jgi:hypothetical protein
MTGVLYQMLIKIHRSYRDTIAVCDSELIGKRFEEGRFQLDIKESFFRGKEIPEEEAVKLMQRMSKEDATFNIVGDISVNAAIKAGIIEENSIGKIQGIPFALVLL